MSLPRASKALSRFKVIDLTRVRSGPTCVRQLADWGADVIMVEMPESVNADSGAMGSREGPDFQNLHRNKRSITLDLKNPKGKEVFLKLLKDADVVVENYRPDVKFRLGIDYESLKKLNPRIVMTSISGFGQDGPYVERPGVDQIAQGMSGLMSITGEPGRGPMRVGIAIADVSAGLFAALGTMAALLERESSGEGQWVQTSLLEANIFIQDFQAARWTMAGEIPEQAGNNHPTGITGAFATQDGAINIAPPPFLWERFVKALGNEELKTDERFSSPKLRIKNRAACNTIIEKTTKTKPSDYWVKYFNDAGIPCGPIYRMDQTFADPQVRHLGIAQTVNSPRLGPLKLIAQPVHLSRTPSTLAVAPPERGEHNEQVLSELGYGKDDIAALKRDGAI